MIDTLGKSIEIVAGVVEKLNRARVCIITVENKSTMPIDRMTHEHSGGEFAELPEDRVMPGEFDTFAAVSSAGSIATGCAGKMTYNVGGMGRCEWTLRWSNPFLGKNSGAAVTIGSEAHLYTVDEVVGGGNSARLRFTIRGGPSTDATRNRPTQE
jgi:hypothetical protein